MIRVTGCSNEEGRQILTENEEDEVTDKQTNGEEHNPINSQQENPPSPPSPRRSPGTPVDRSSFQGF